MQIAAKFPSYEQEFLQIVQPDAAALPGSAIDDDILDAQEALRRRLHDLHLPPAAALASRTRLSLTQMDEALVAFARLFVEEFSPDHQRVTRGSKDDEGFFFLSLLFVVVLGIVAFL